MKALAQNGRVVFIQRPLDRLSTGGRPLSKSPEALKSMYETRFPLYNKYGQLTFNAEGSIEENINALTSLLGYEI